MFYFSPIEVVPREMLFYRSAIGDRGVGINRSMSSPLYKRKLALCRNVQCGNTVCNLRHCRKAYLVILLRSSRRSSPPCSCMFFTAPAEYVSVTLSSGIMGMRLDQNVRQ